MTATAGTWTVVGRVEDLTAGEGRTYVVDGRQVAVFLLADGTIRATDAVCPHRGGPLADGQIDGRVVVCPLHQYAFSLTDGTCTDDRTTIRPAVAVHPAGSATACWRSGSAAVLSVGDEVLTIVVVGPVTGATCTTAQDRTRGAPAYSMNPRWRSRSA